MRARERRAAYGIAGALAALAVAGIKAGRAQGQAAESPASPASPVSPASARATSTGGQFALTDENDAFAPGHTTDEHYTAGTRLTYALPHPRWWPGLLRDVGDGTAFVNEDRPASGHVCHALARTTVVLGQNLYTPRNIDARDLLVGDRPYGAYLYAGLLYSVSRERQFRSLELDLGVTGQQAHGKEVRPTPGPCRDPLRQPVHRRPASTGSARPRSRSGTPRRCSTSSSRSASWYSSSTSWQSHPGGSHTWTASPAPRTSGSSR